MADRADPNQPNPPPNPPQHEIVIPNAPNPNNQLLRQFFVPNAYEPSLTIDFTRLGNADFELKPSIMNLLPSFYGRTNESSLEHVTEFIVVCSTLGHLEVSQEIIRLRLFPFTLKDKAKSWFCNLAGDSITSWNERSSRFHQRFYPMSRTADLKTAIRTFAQFDHETFHET